MRAVILVLMSFVLGCGASTVSRTDSGGAHCGTYQIGDPCVNETNFAECQAREAECPGEVRVLEVCPVRFVCAH